LTGQQIWCAGDGAMHEKRGWGTDGCGEVVCWSSS